MKYEKYYEATCGAIRAKKATELTMAVVGAGRGPLVAEALRAIETTGVKATLYAIEKNPSAVYIINRRNQDEWGNKEWVSLFFPVLR